MSVIAMILSLSGNVLINYKKVKQGYITWIISNALWIVIGLTATEVNIPQVIMYFVYTILNLQGLHKWRDKNE